MLSPGVLFYYMVKRDPDDLISALNKNLKSQKAPVLRFTFKRGGLWKPEFAKIHSRIAKAAIRDKIKTQCANEEERQWPLLVRYKENDKENTVRLNCPIKLGRGANYIESVLNVFRVNFFKKKGEAGQAVKRLPTKANPLSKTSANKKQKTERNKDRRKKRLQIKRSARVKQQKGSVSN